MMSNDHKSIQIIHFAEFQRSKLKVVVSFFHLKSPFQFATPTGRKKKHTLLRPNPWPFFTSCRLNFWKYLIMLQHFPRSTTVSHFCTALTSETQKKTSTCFVTFLGRAGDPAEECVPLPFRSVCRCGRFRSSSGPRCKATFVRLNWTWAHRACGRS